MPKRAPKNQRTIYDLVLEDADLAEALQDRLDNADAASLYRDAGQRIKARLNNEHPEAINAKTDDGRDQWIVVDGYRFVAKTAARPAGKKVPAAGTSWKLDAYAIEDVRPAADPPATETVLMSVDGADDQPVKRPRRSKSNGAAADFSPHAFVGNPETPGLCGACHMREAHELHATAEQTSGRVMAELHPEIAPHLFVAVDRQDTCGECGRFADAPMHILPDVEQPAATIEISEAGDAATQVDEQLSPLAAGLIDEARRAPVDADDAREQAEAEARLAHRV